MHSNATLIRLFSTLILGDWMMKQHNYNTKPDNKSKKSGSFFTFQKLIYHFFPTNTLRETAEPEQGTGSALIFTHPDCVKNESESPGVGTVGI
jgi:hypothetical protein